MRSKFGCRLCDLQDSYRSRPLEKRDSLKAATLELILPSRSLAVVLGTLEFQPALGVQPLNRMDLRPVAFPCGMKLPASSRAQGSLQMELHRAGPEQNLGKTPALAEVLLRLASKLPFQALEVVATEDVADGFGVGPFCPTSAGDGALSTQGSDLGVTNPASISFCL